MGVTFAFRQSSGIILESDLLKMVVRTGDISCSKSGCVGECCRGLRLCVGLGCLGVSRHLWLL